MKHFNLLISFFFSVLFVSPEVLLSQEPFFPQSSIASFKKKDYTSSPIVKTRYSFDVGAVSGREYLRQQDLVDSKGNFKSSGIFSEEGNKSGDLRYTYDASGKLISQELKFIGKNEKEVTIFNADGNPSKIERRTKGDTLLGYSQFSYSELGKVKEEQVFRGEKLILKKINDDVYSPKGRLLQTCHYQLDSTGARVPGAFPLTVFEYDNEGQILQVTTYNNLEKRKMLHWVYYKYQLDNDYRVIKQSGFNEEQQEIYRSELAYTDSSITSTVYSVCKCPEKSMDKGNTFLVVFNPQGDKIREVVSGADNAVIQTTTWKYNDFGNVIETLIVKAAEPQKLIKSKTILEYYTDQASTNKNKMK